MMTKKYARLTFNERIEIEKLLSHRKRYAEIARALNRNKSSIQREVAKQDKDLYKAIEGERLAVGSVSNRRGGKTKMRQCPELEKHVLEKLNLRWSPWQIHVSLQHNFPENKAMQISHEAIYLYIYLHSKKELKNLLISELRQKRKYRGNVRRGKDKRTTIQDPIRIDERPEEVKGRQIPGHWEGDLIMGKDRSSAIGTLVERTTRTIILVPLKARDATTVRKAFEKEFKTIPAQMKKTLTYDNGSEMAEHKLFTMHTKVQVYFTHPYSPWERPTNENSNGLVRDYFPAGTDFTTISKERLKEVQNQLNERPRHVLDYRTPKEVFEEKILQLMEAV
jgi:transposase, IS30 family